MTNRFKHSRISKQIKIAVMASVLIFTGVGLTIPASKADNINTQLNDMFGTMSNTTLPGDMHSVTRDGYTGGGFTLRNQMKSLSPVNIQMPSAAGGCGGIDLFGGSFSFINADEFVQMLRNIAANASGLAFQLALNAMDSVLDNAISRMQSVIQKMNDLTANSCQLAKGLLVDTAGAFGQSAKSSVSAQLSSDGLVDQFDAFMSEQNGKPSAVAQKDENGKRTACKDYGNTMWCMLGNGNFNNYFLNSGDEQKEFAMSVIGTYIIPKNYKTDKTGALIGGAPVELKPVDVAEALDALVNGTDSFQIYKCDDTASCPNPTTETLKFDGLANKIITFFNDSGYLQKIHDGVTPTQQEYATAKYYNVNQSSSTAAQLARHDVNQGKSYIRSIAPTLAYSAANNFLRDMLTTAATSARYQVANDNPAAPVYQKSLVLISDARTSLQLAYSTMATQYGGEDKIIRLRAEYLNGLPVKNFEQVQADQTAR